MKIKRLFLFSCFLFGCATNNKYIKQNKKDIVAKSSTNTKMKQYLRNIIYNYPLLDKNNVNILSIIEAVNKMSLESDPFLILSDLRFNEGKKIKLFKSTKCFFKNDYKEFLKYFRDEFIKIIPQLDSNFIIKHFLKKSGINKYPHELEALILKFHPSLFMSIKQIMFLDNFIKNSIEEVNYVKIKKIIDFSGKFDDKYLTDFMTTIYSFRKKDWQPTLYNKERFIPNGLHHLNYENWSLIFMYFLKLSKNIDWYKIVTIAKSLDDLIYRGIILLPKEYIWEFDKIRSEIYNRTKRMKNIDLKAKYEDQNPYTFNRYVHDKLNLLIDIHDHNTKPLTIVSLTSLIFFSLYLLSGLFHFSYITIFTLIILIILSLVSLVFHFLSSCARNSTAGHFD